MTMPHKDNNGDKINDKYKKKRYGHCDFEIDPHECELWGEMKATVYEKDYPEGEHDAKTIIACDEDWYVKVEWRLWGSLMHHLCGYFCVCVYLESIGPGEDYSLPCDEDDKPCIEWIPMDPCGDGYYEVVCKVPAGSVECGDCGKLYEVAVTLTSFDYCKKPGHIAAYCKGPTLMFYEAPHPAVSIVDNAFNPYNMTIESGQSVTWTHGGTSPHTVTSNPGPAGCTPPSAESFDSGTLNAGNTFHHTFNTPGTYAYHCEVHGCAMAGIVTVT